MIVVNSRFLTQPITGVQRFSIELSLQLKKKLGSQVLFVSPSNILHHDLAEILEVKVLSIKDNKINATLNFKQKKSSNKKEINSLDTLNFVYGFDTIKRNMKFWQKKAMIEMRNSK